MTTHDAVPDDAMLSALDNRLRTPNADSLRAADAIVALRAALARATAAPTSEEAEASSKWLRLIAKGATGSDDFKNGVMVNAATLIEQQAREIARLRMALEKMVRPAPADMQGTPEWGRMVLDAHRNAVAALEGHEKWAARYDFDKSDPATRLFCAASDWMDRANRAEQERDELRADAERYRYIEANPWRAIDLITAKCDVNAVGAVWRRQLREAIDAARKGENNDRAPSRTD